MNDPDLSKLRSELMKINVASTSLLVIEKTNKALANIKRADTLLKKSELTLRWAIDYESKRSQASRIP